MTEKELKRMSREELLEIIYQYEKRTQELTEENARLSGRLGERQIKLEQAGSIAEASLALNQIFESAQQAADQYIASIRGASERVEAETQTILDQARQEADALRKKGQEEYEEKVAQAERECAEKRRKITDLLLLDSDLSMLLGEGGKAGQGDG